MKEIRKGHTNDILALSNQWSLILRKKEQRKCVLSDMGLEDPSSEECEEQFPWMPASLCKMPKLLNKAQL